MSKNDIEAKIAKLAPERRRALDILLRREADRQRAAQWLYNVTWRPFTVEHPGGSNGRESWLVFADASGVGEALARALTSAGAVCQVVHAARNGRADGVEPTSPDAVGAVIGNWMATAADVRRIAYLWPLDTTAEAATSADSLARDQELVLAGALHVAQAISRGGGAEPRLWLFTRGAQDIGDGSPVAIAQATLWGFGRCVALEHPELWGGLVDLDPKPNATLPEGLVAHLRSPAREGETAWRDGRPLVSRLVKAQIDAKSIPQPKLVADGAYVITGGLGDLGLYLAEWIASRGARHIALVSRKAPWPEVAAAIARVEAHGARVVPMQCDITRDGDVAGLLERVDRTMAPVRGLVHAAAVVDYGMMRQQTWKRFTDVLAPKVSGTWNLHAHSRARQLDFFAMYASLSGFGYEASSNYAAANTFMDAFAYWRRRQGAPATAIDWTAWAGIGGVLRLSRADQDRIAASGVGNIDPNDGGAVMSLVIGGGTRIPPQIVVHPIVDAEKFTWYQHGKGDPPLFSELQREVSGQPVVDDKRPLVARLRELSPPEARTLLEAQVKTSIIAILGLDAGTVVDPQSQVIDLGMTSLLANDFRLRLAPDLGLPRGAFPATLVFNFPTVQSLVEHILTDVLPRAEVPVVVAKVEAPPAAPAPIEAFVPAAPVAAPKIALGYEEPIAIVGVSCRFPGGVEDAESFWRLLADGADPVRKVPKERWDADAVYDPDPDAPGKSITRSGSFIDGWEQFDPLFFGMSPREATATDPQQRILLELTWQALADAGYAPEDVSGSKMGVFAAVYGADHLGRVARAGWDAIDVYTAAGIAHGVAAGRLSYLLGVHGPSTTLDAACSSSLVGVHLAAASLRRRESDLAVVAASSAMLSPHGHILLSKTRMVSRDGRSKAFDASADGYGRSEGGCVMVVKRLADAVRDGDVVYGVIRGTAVNQDGRSASLVAPSGPAQSEIARAALRDAGLSDDDIDYVECAGTGSSMGDSIEYGALAEVFGASLMRAKPLLIGSVKTNVGHTESVSGLAGLLKVLVSMRHEALPPHLHLRELNPECRPQNGELIVATESRPWARGFRPRRAGVQSYGMSGTNAHVIVEEPPITSAKAVDGGPYVFALSARTRSSLDTLVASWARYMREHPGSSAAALVAAASRGRASLAHRLAVVARSRDELLAALEAGGEPVAGAVVRRGERAQRGAPKTGFIFPGTQPNIAALTRHLYANHARFRDVVERCNAVLKLDTPLTQIFASGRPSTDGSLASAAVVSYVAQCALWETWSEHGPVPLAVFGSGLGELAAAYAAGVIGLEDGARALHALAKIYAEAAQGFVAYAVEEDLERTRALLGTSPRVQVLASESSKRTLIGGKQEDLAGVLTQLQTQGVPATRLAARLPFHSRLADAKASDISAIIGRITLGEPRLPIISSVTGRPAKPGDVTNPDYWVRLLRSSVQVKEAVRSLAKLGCEVCVEVGAGTELGELVFTGLTDSAIAVVPSLDDDVPDDLRFSVALAAAFAAGGSAPRPAAGAPRSLSTPAYAFERQRCWLESKPAVEAAAVHPLLGRRDSGSISRYVSEHGTGKHAFLQDHGNFGIPVFPGMGFIEMALAAARDAFHGEATALLDVSFERALLLEAVPREVSFDAKVTEPGRLAYVIESRAAGGGEWVTHTTGSIARAPESQAAPGYESLAALRARLKKSVSVEQLYAAMRANGQDYGAAFRGMREVSRAPDAVGEALGHIVLPEHVVGEGDFAFAHPALLDACGHPTYVAVSGDAKTPGSFMFAGADRIRVYGKLGREVWSHVVARPVSTTATRPVFSSDIRVYDASGRVVVEMLGVRNLGIEADTLSKLGSKPAPASAVAQATVAAAAEPAVVGSGEGLRELVHREVAAALGLAADQRVAAKQVLKDLGLDSLVAVQLRNRLQTALGISLPVTLLFEYPTLQLLLGFITEKLGSRVVPATAAAQPAVAAPVAAPAKAVTKTTNLAASASVSPRLAAVLSAIEQLDEGELGVLADELLGSEA
ncbi:MAG TPA: SDR family NAD(P)-dependent oxidoreductase [Myxococcota bacterium]|nr:SDR family NAD(P)-dependent oxidoreductase [Myxococcota bacterium]